jgi:ArsR family transcriptional regulator
VVTAQQDSVDSLLKTAALFSVLAAPIRLKIIGQLCKGESNVSQLLDVVHVSQPNISRHLGVLYQAGVVSKRRDGTHIFYQIANEGVVDICKAMCLQ